MPTNINRNHPVGVFDSGLGGLTVVKELMRQLPKEDIVYFGDTARVPYGTKSKESIIRFSKENVILLLKHKVKVIVVACNTSSSVAISVLRDQFSIPIVDVLGPGAKKAVETTKNQRIGVIATPATINSGGYTKRIKQIKPSSKVIPRACPLFVPLAEEGWFNKKVTRLIALEYLQTLKASRVDTLILGCTHYPLLKSVIQKVMGRHVTLIDSAKEVALGVKKLLEENGLKCDKKGQARYSFLVSDAPQHFQILAKRFLGKPIQNVQKINNV